MRETLTCCECSWGQTSANLMQTRMIASRGVDAMSLCLESRIAGAVPSTVTAVSVDDEAGCIMSN